ncbi:MAG: ATP-dependent Clp protease proteolytic subunit [Bacteroidales bacterium]|nr:ATP-dependent Clp protease proteolytic subunit [Bacteroidales bacterium]
MNSSIRQITALLLLLLTVGITGLPAQENDTTGIQDDETTLVYKFDIKEQIAKPIWRKTKMAFQEAGEKNADIVLIHMNTYGGAVDAADSIRTAVLQSKIPVYVFIDNNAASAGALISIASDSIYMRPGANIGAATVVNQQGEAMPDKYQSYMRSMMRATAEEQGRDPDIAEAMVDERIAIKGVTDSGKVVTFTANEAIKFGFCEGKAESIPQVLEKAGVENYEIIEQQLTTVDKIISFLINPAVSGILIMLIIGGIYFELQSPGLGFPSAAAVLAALLYFAPLYLQGLADNWEILIFIAGLILIGVEIFALPGFGVAGIPGIILMVGGLTLAMIKNVGFDFTGVEMDAVIKALFIVIIAMFLALLSSFYLGKKLFTTHTFGELALDAIQDREEGFTSSRNEYKSMLGKTGKARTVLRPSGKVEIEDEIYDATAETNFIDKGSEVIVTRYQTSSLFVRKKEEDEA